MRHICIALYICVLLQPAKAQSPEPWFFAVLADPQFGMYAKDQNFTQETANLEFAITNLNRLRPRFVVICGDLVNRTGDPAEIAEYKRVLKELDPSIPVYNVAGNHDVGNIPSPATLDHFHSSFGPDYYTFSINNLFGIVLDSSLIGSPDSDPEAAKQQEAWLRKVLADVRSTPDREIVVFQHIPYFIRNRTEAEDYFNIRPPVREKYLDLLNNSGVRYVFAGHYHRNAVASDRSITEIVTGAVGMPLGQSTSGFRIVVVSGHKLDSTWLCLGGIPNQIDLHKPLATPCPQ